MLKNYITISRCDMAKHRSYTFLNLVGLAFGICTCIVIFLVTDYKFSFDRFNSDGNRAYPVVGTIQQSSQATGFSISDVSKMVAFKEQYRGFKPKGGFTAVDGSVSMRSDETLKKFDHIILCNHPR